jgi:hypothetical protein
VTPPARRVLDQALTEDQWTATIIGTDTIPGLARTLGWVCLHHHDTRREVVNPRTGERTLIGDKDAAGLPDWLLIRDRLIWVELKAEGNGPNPEQRRILRLIFDAGGEAYVWRPSDYEEAERILLQRYGPRWELALWDVSQANLRRAGVLPRTTDTLGTGGRT